jgi:spermidine synthase
VTARAPGEIPPRALGFLFACFTVSGASGLVYEVVWLRWLVHLFGATTLAVATILTAFMAGLALGSWLGGRLAARLRAPLRAYGWLEIAIGAWALGLPATLEAIPPVLRWLGATEASSFTALSLARFALAGALLLVPTACMGATLPLLAQAAAPRLEHRGGRVGRLYAVNTAGAVLGTAAAGFLLLPRAGVSLTNRLAVIVNLAVGLAALALSAWMTRAPAAPAAAAAVTPAPPPAAPTPAPPPDRSLARMATRVALGTVLASGALAMVYEVAWTRALALVLGSSVYAFTVMLTTFLLGLAGGSWLVARRVDRLAEPAVALALVQAGIAVAAFAGLAVLGDLPWLFLRLFAWSDGRHDLLLALEFLLSGALMLGPALGCGAVFPLAVRLAGGEAAGRAVGTLYAANTVGAIAGSFAGGFLLVPAVGIRATLLLAVLLNLACAFAVALAVPPRRPALRTAVLAGVPLLCLAVPLLAPAWSAATMSSGVAVYARSLSQLSRREFEARRQRARLLFYDEGLTTTVSVEADGRAIYLRVNGKTDASTGVDMPTQVLLGHLPLLLHPAPADAVVIGLGSGISVGSALRHPFRRVTVVELEPAVVTASRFFDGVSGRPLADPRTRLVVNDARNFLLLTRERFDVIVSEPSNPWMTGAASLFTREFFALARERLRPGGVFGQWVQLYSLTPDMLRTIVRTFAAVFPHAAVFQSASGDTVLVGSATPLRPDYPALAARLAAPAVADDLARVGIRDVADLAARLVLDATDVERFVQTAVLNTDDNAHVEFTAPRTLYVDAVAENLQRMTGAFQAGGPWLDALAGTAPDGFAATLAARLLERGQPRQAEAVARVALARRPRPDLLRTAARAAAAHGETARAEQQWRAALALAPGDADTLLDLAAHLAARGEAAEARALVDRLRGPGGAEAALRAGALLYRLGAHREAAARLAGVPPTLAGAALVSGLNRLALGDAAEAERLLRQALAEGDDARGRDGLATALEQLGRPADAEAERRRARELDRVAALRHRRQARVRVAAGDLRWGAHDLGQAIELVPGDLELRGERGRLLERMGERRAAIAEWEGVARAFPEYAHALLEVATLWDAEGDREQARAALRRYVAIERDEGLRRQAEILLRRP